MVLYLDAISLFIISPIGFIGFILNLFCLIILSKIKISNTNLYIYLKIYSLNSALIGLVLSFSFVGYSPRFFPYFANYYAQLYRCKIYNAIGCSLYSFGNLMDILIAIERLDYLFLINHKNRYKIQY